MCRCSGRSRRTAELRVGGERARPCRQTPLGAAIHPRGLGVRRIGPRRRGRRGHIGVVVTTAYLGIPMSTSSHDSFWRRHWREQRGLLLFLLCFGVLRTAVADWNPVPSGSMRPTILEGDVVLVNRLAYDLKLPLTDHILLPLGEPRRGDIAVFSSPQDGTRLIKRIVGLPGDLVELRQGRLYLNGEAATYDQGETRAETVLPGLMLNARRERETLGGHARTVQWLPGLRGDGSADFGPLRVPEGHFFMMGDNRDDSADSRVIGPVPRERLNGRAHHILVSADIKDRWQPRFARWGAALR